MFEKARQIAQQAATNASRREFLGRLGHGALTAAAAAASYLAFGSEAQAGRCRCRTDGQCPRGHICDAGRCVRGVRPPQACGTGSDNYCLGSVEGAYCQIGTTAGICVGAPACYCRPSSGPRGPVGPRGPRR
jgi:hypothetical protein